MNGCRGIETSLCRVLDMHLKTIPASSGELSVIQQGLPEDRQGHLHSDFSISPHHPFVGRTQQKDIV